MVRLYLFQILLSLLEYPPGRLEGYNKHYADAVNDEEQD